MTGFLIDRKKLETFIREGNTDTDYSYIQSLFDDEKYHRELKNILVEQFNEMQDSDDEADERLEKALHTLNYNIREAYIDANDRKADPNIQRDRPTTNFAMNGHAAWKGIDVTVLFQGSAGRKDYWLNNYNNVNFPQTHYASTWDHWNNPWTVENRDGAWPRLSGSGNRVESSFWLDDLSYLRMKNLQIGYSFPKLLLRQFGFSNIRVYGSVENLFTVTKFRGLDPEKSSYANDVYPLNKVFLIGLNIGI